MRPVCVNGLKFYQFDYLTSSAGIVHGVFTRQGGVSPAPWASLNVSGSTGDSAEAVTENNRRLLESLGLVRAQTVRAWLNHGDRVAVVGREHLGEAVPDTDALLSATPGLALWMCVADCVPVLFYDAARRVIAIAHAGWPGVAAGIVAKTLRGMRDSFGCQPREVWVGIGPAIRAECYPFGQDLAEHVAAACPPGAPVIVSGPDGAVHLDLIMAVKSQLCAQGVANIEDSGICTACHTDEWFSHRAEKKTGRFGIVFGLE